MRKLICIIMALCIMTSTVMAAPYRYEYFNTTKFHIQTLLNTAKKYNVDVEYKKPAENNNGTNTSENNSSGSTDTSDVKQPNTMSNVVGSLCVVTSVSKALDNQEKVTKLTYYVNNSSEEKTCYINNDSYVYAGNYDVDNINVGSLVYIDLKDDAIVRRYSVVAVTDTATNLPVIDYTALYGTYSSSKIKPVYSYIVDYRTAGGNILIMTENDYEIVAAKNAKLYTVDIDKRNTNVVSGDCLAADIDRADYNEQTGKTKAYMMFAIEYDDEAVFVCSYTTPVEIDGDVTQ